MIGHEVLKARLEANITQTELGKRAGMTPVNISRIESGKRSPRKLTLARIARGLGLPTDHFLDLGT